MSSQASQGILGVGSLHGMPGSSLLVYQPVLDRACEAVTLIPSQFCSQSVTRAKAGDAGAVIFQHSQTTVVAQPITPVQQHRCQELQRSSTSQKQLWHPCEAMNRSTDRASKPMQRPAQPLNHPARLKYLPAMNYRPTAEPTTPTPGYTVTTWSPTPLLQHMQQKSRAICEAAAAGAIAAAATIPGGRPTREDSIKEHCSTGIPASKVLRQLDVPGPAAEALSNPAAELDGLMAPVTPDLSGTATAALQTSSARFLKEMEAEDISERLLMLAEKRRQVLLLAQEQHILQHQHMNYPATNTPTQKAHEDRAAATNNLAIRRNSGSGSCNNNMCNSEATMAVSPACQGLNSFNSASASPCLNNSSTPALSSANTVSRMSQQQTAVTPVSQVPTAPGTQSVSNPVSQQVVLQSGRGGPALSTAAWHDLNGWLGAEPPRYGSALTSRLPSFTYGVQALLKPSAREEAVMEALPNAAYAVTAMQGLSAGLQDTTARQLAVAAVAAARTECGAANVPATAKGMVPISACGTVGYGSRSANLSGAPRPGSAADAGGANTPCHSTHTAGAQPFYSADHMEASWQQQQQQAQEAQYQSAWGTNAFAAPAAEGGTHWVAGAFGIGPECTYWQQHQQELASAAYGAWGPGMAAGQVPAQHSPQPLKRNQQRTRYTAGCDPFNLHFYQQQQQQQQPKSRHAEPRCPSSPRLEGVKDWEPDADDALPSSAEWGYSNSRKRSCEDVFEEMQPFGVGDWQLGGLGERPSKRAHTMI